MKNIFLVFGEIVWDIFPDEKRLGGAPLNFAYYFQKAGGNPRILSAVGEDELGLEAISKIQNLSLHVDFVEKSLLPTGTVEITLQDNRHRFKVVRGTAWEQITVPPKLPDQSSIAGLYLGTLTRISINNKDCGDKLLRTAKGNPICLDVNLRKPFFNRDDLNFLLNNVTHVKMNDSEARLMKKMGLIDYKTLEEAVEDVLVKYPVAACCITLGGRGAIGATRASGVSRVPGLKIKEGGDSVGAGDSFAAFWLYNLISGRSSKDSLEIANGIAAKVASAKGAITEL